VSWASVRGEMEVCAEVGEAVGYLVKYAYGTGDGDEILDEWIGGIKKRRKEENDSVTT
jgi:hypothetical protein